MLTNIFQLGWNHQLVNHCKVRIPINQPVSLPVQPWNSKDADHVAHDAGVQWQLLGPKTPKFGEPTEIWSAVCNLWSKFENYIAGFCAIILVYLSYLTPNLTPNILTFWVESVSLLLLISCPFRTREHQHVIALDDFHESHFV